MSTQNFILRPEDRSPALSVVGIEIAVLVSDADSRSQQITIQSGDEGMGPPPHSHDWDESFYVTDGQVQFSCGGQTTMCLPGTLVYVPAGTTHAFSFGPGGGKMLEITGAGSKAVPFFTALDREVPPGEVDVPKVVQVGSEYGVAFHL